MPPKEIDNITIEDARILFRNFAGAQTQYNPPGKRNFCLVLPEDIAIQAVKDGWNVKALRPREEGDPERPYLQVEVKFEPRPPKIVLITSKGRTDLPEELVGMLDHADIKQVDLIVRPYSWTVRDNSGVKAYLKTMFVILNEDYLERKYADVREIGPESEIDIIDAEIVEDAPAIGGGRKAIGSGR